MNLISIISNFNNIFSKPVINFYGSEYQTLFFSQLLNQISKNIEVKHCDTELIGDYSEFYMSFLGQQVFYWFSDISPKNNKDLHRFLYTYMGPNFLAFFSSSKFDSENTLNIEINEINTIDEALQLAKFLLGFVNKSLEFNLKQFFKQNKSFKIDQLILLSNYGAAVGSSINEFMQTWYDKIVVSQESLFTLSSLLFAKDPDFFMVWFKVKDIYQPPFWTAFWTEQFFRAYWYTYYQKSKNYVEAKKIAYKLPFSFINSDFKKYSPHDFIKAHDFFYNLDCLIKNGSDFIPEAFFSQFIS